MTQNSVALILLLFLAVATGGAFVMLSIFVGRVRAPKERLLTYECGVDPVGSSHGRFPVKFFLVAVLFIIFDVEVVFLYPWALIFREFRDMPQGVFLMGELVVFVVMLALALLYAWGKGALDWEEGDL